MFWAPVWLTLSLPKELHLIMTLQTQRTGAQLFLIHFVSPASQLKLLVPRSFLVYRKYISYLQLCNRVCNFLKEISPEYSLEGLKLKLQYFGHLL